MIAWIQNIFLVSFNVLNVKENIQTIYDYQLALTYISLLKVEEVESLN